MRTDLKGHQQELQGLPMGVALAMCLVLLLPMSAHGQPSSGGALQSIGGIAKRKIFRGPGDASEVPVAAVAGGVELTAACTLSATAMTKGCADGVYRCGPELSASCEEFAGHGGGLDFVAAGTGLRHVGESYISLRGAPKNAQAVAAWLYWGALVPAEQPAAVQEIVLERYTLTGRLVGLANEPCWDQNNLFALYSASVLPYLEAGINGDYALELPAIENGAKVDGSDPWENLTQDGSVRLEGASLVVVYQHNEVPQAAQIYLHEGPQMLVGSLELQHHLEPAIASGAELRHLRLGGDGQIYGIQRQPVAPFRTLISFANQPWIELRGSSSQIDRFSDWQGTDAAPSSQLWDTQVTHASASELGMRPGMDSYAIRYETEKPVGGESRFLYDCVEIGVHLLGIH